MTPDLRHIDTWLFDLDNTLYPHENGFMRLMEKRMTGVVARITGLPHDEALKVQKQHLREHGTTLAGLIVTHKIDPAAFLNEVHDISMDVIAPNPDLRVALSRLPGRRLVFTNADEAHALRVLDRLGITDLFDDLFHIALADYVPKPNPTTFARMMDRHAVAPRVTCFFEDSVLNLEPAAELGMTTVLVGPNTLESDASFVHHRTHHLAPFLMSARIREI